MDAAAAHLDKEKDVKTVEPSRLHCEEVSCQDMRSVLASELPPTIELTASELVEPDATASLF